MVFTTRKGRFHALREIDLQVKKGEFVTLIGHSGCGKSTLLNRIAGLTRSIRTRSGTTMPAAGLRAACWCRRAPRVVAR